MSEEYDALGPIRFEYDSSARHKPFELLIGVSPMPDSPFHHAAVRSRQLIAVFAGLMTFGIADAQTSTPEPAAMAWVSGITTYRGQHKGQRLEMRANVVTPGNSQSAGASAAFGVDDSGQVFFIGRTEYQPMQGLSTVRRLFETPKPPMTTEQGPRFLMVCSWPLKDSRQQAGPISAGYAERDDSSARTSKDGTLQESFSVHWIGVPAARAKDKFSKADYCGEIAKTSKSSAPLWLLPGKER